MTDAGDLAPPTSREILDDELELVSQDADPSWRHGCYMTDVYFRDTDSTYWQASYQRSGDGEWNGLREGDADIVRVYPYTETVTRYRNVP